ncbi:hypothetical protein PsYK624_106120 [Phanerochaete sordida]|uniref:Protein kinase domain-containing protein n=1 Tax=Phanerochaete sordida TaxID=48140 RepID=A0A9P3GGE5_9APHY|nr:hypothetical protein PsYK624_106120 [Phanerochaete sordida]
MGSRATRCTPPTHSFESMLDLMGGMPSAASSEFVASNRSRNAVAEDAGWSVPQLPLKRFCDTLLPKKLLKAWRTKDLVPLVLKQLTKQGDYLDRTKRWNAFPQDPATLRNKDFAFRGLLDIAHAIDKAFKTVCDIDAQGNVATASLMMGPPGRFPVHNDRATETKPGCIFVNDAGDGGQRYWSSVVSCGELRCKDDLTALNDNIHQTMWNLHHLMRKDPRRRFAHSFTIENRTMRLWFCNRSTYAVSDAFDFCSEPRYIIHYFLSLMYASEAQLGWDTTMVPVAVDGYLQYDITVNESLYPGTGESRVYRTSELLSDGSTFSVRGRATRVWRARLLEYGQPVGEDVAIRDSWVDADKPREATVINNILADVPPDTPGGEDHDTEHSRNDLREYLLTVLVSGDVVVDGLLDRTQPVPYTPASFNIRQKDTSERAQSRRTKDKAALQEELKNHHEEVDDMMPIPPHYSEQYHVKAHHRIVYKEVCVPLHEVKTLDNALWTIHGAVHALKIIHSAGWVHRDISGGNILLSDNGVKLADFEYAKKFDSEVHGGTHEIKTGTATYMSIEVSAGKYLFRFGHATPKEETSTTTENVVDQCDRRDKPMAPMALSVDIDLPVDHHTPAMWRYNPLNDMESLWWASAYFVFDKDVTFVPRDPQYPLPDSLVEAEDVRRVRLLDQHAFSDRIFHRIDLGQRMCMVVASGSLAGDIPTLHPYLRARIAPELEEMRQALIACYREAEKDVEKIGRSVAQPLYRAFYTHLYRATGAANHPLFSIQIRALATTIADEEIVAPERAWGEKPAQPATLAEEEAEPAKAAYAANEGDDEECDRGDNNEGRRKRAKLF